MMDLFVINRYTGNNATDNASEELQLRKNLINKINQRKKLVANKKYENLHSEVQNGAESETHLSDDELSGNINPLQKKWESKRTHSLDETFKTLADSSQAEKEKLWANEKFTGSKSDTFVSQPESEPFSILGTDSYEAPKKVKRPIPHWLANPSVVSTDLKNLDTEVDSLLDLDDMFRKKLKENGITHFFPVQRQIIPWLLENNKKPAFFWPSDICVSAPTGSGKTLAFVLPILQALCKRIVPFVRAIVVLPVQDLAVQVYKVFEIYSSPANLKVILLSKQRPFIEEQAMINGKDIIVTTAGRLVDHLINTDGLNLQHLRFLVIDEADRVMDDMQNDWLYHLNKKIFLDSSKSYKAPTLTYNNLSDKKRPPQKLLFSATLSQDPEKLQQLGLFQPKLFTSVVSANISGEQNTSDKFIGKYTTPAELQEYYALSTKAEKPLIINHLLLSKCWRGILCFVNSVETTKRLSNLLKNMNRELRVRSISANLNLIKRDKLINDFARGKIDILISSDALTRGIDIPQVKYVISYSLPKYLKTYIHRIGRTGRAGKEGVSLILLTEKEVSKFHQMMEESGKKAAKEIIFEENDFEKYIPSYEKALMKLKSRLQKGKEITLTKIKSIKSKNSNLKKRN